MTEDPAEMAARPIPATIPMPDHPVRQTAWFQAYVRLARPTAEWVTAGGLLYAFVVGPTIERPLAEGYLVQVLLFAGGIFGIRAFEKVKGVA
ncbi:hypothetical protein [Novosphingobium soli]|uniref:Uncharacterized protein n=1 Tax=Novosphingobium soli TaxID=574956 RepID=A0ABV6CXP0_9SPHN